MSSPVLSKSQAFSASAQQQSPQYIPWDPSGQQQYTQPTNGQSPYGQPQYGQPMYGQPTYGQQYAPPPQAGFQQPPAQSWQAPVQPPTSRGVMTLDDVLTKTLITLGTTIVIAVLTGWLTWTMDLPLTGVLTVGTLCMLATVIFALIAGTRRKIGPVTAIVFALLEGVFLGAYSVFFEASYPGIVIQTVMATMVAAALTLMAFRSGKFRLSTKVRKVVMIAIIAYAVTALLNLFLALLGVNLGLFPGPTGSVSIWAWLLVGVGAVLAVLSLLDDFQYIEQGIANRAPASESWRAAYGLTVTLVWLYINLLRLISYIRR